MSNHFIKILAILFFLAFLCGCNSKNSSASIADNSIQKMPLSMDNERIISLIESDHTKLNLFCFNAKDFSNINIWMEVYENGKLISKNNEISYAFMSSEKTGDILITMQKNPDFYYGFTILTDNSKLSSLSEACTLHKDNYSFGAMRSSVNIEKDKEIIIYCVLFSNKSGGIPVIEDEQAFISNPELLMNYSVAHIIKCRFS
jgi:hypothetical protein